MAQKSRMGEGGGWCEPRFKEGKDPGPGWRVGQRKDYFRKAYFKFDKCGFRQDRDRRRIRRELMPSAMANASFSLGTIVLVSDTIVKVTGFRVAYTVSFDAIPDCAPNT